MNSIRPLQFHSLRWIVLLACLGWLPAWTHVLRGQSLEPPVDPAFAQNTVIWLSPRVAPADAIQEGTEAHPFLVGSGRTFDQFMKSFSGIPNLTFRLQEGVFETAGNYELPHGSRPSTNLWQPGNGWRILGAGIGKTIIRLVSPEETKFAKYQVLGNFHPGLFVEHLEVAYLTLDADGARHSRTLDSSFGCMAVAGSFIHFHDLECINAFNALNPAAPTAQVNRELFVLGIGGKDGRQATNNWIRHCRVTVHPDSPKSFPGAVEGLTTLVANASNNEGADTIPDYTWGSRIEGCVVDGVSPNTRIHGVTMFGCQNGLCRDNLVINTRYSVYADDGVWTPRLYLLNNVISNTLIGIYFHYIVPQHRWGDAVVQSNVVYACSDCANSANPYTLGISFNGMTNTTVSSYGNLLVTSNHVIAPVRTSGVGSDADSALDYGIQVINADASLIHNNTISLLRDYRALRTWKMPGTAQSTRFCTNYNALGRVLIPMDMSTRACQESYLPHPELCELPLDCPRGTLYEAPFAFAATMPVPYPGSIAPPKALHLVWLAREGELIPPTQLETVPGAFDGLSTVSREADRGGVRFHVHIPQSLDYQIWAKMKLPTPTTTGFFDVEMDGERRLFGSLQTLATTDWTWQLVTERLPDLRTNQNRRRFLAAGWHTLTFRTRTPGVHLDMVCLTSATTQSWVPQDRVLRSLLSVENQGAKRAELARELPWNRVFEAESGDREPPMEIIADRNASGGTFVRSVVPHRGHITQRFQVPRTQAYQIAVRIRPDPEEPSHRSVSMLLDGQEWITTGDETPAWQWVTQWGITGSESLNPATQRTGYRLTSGWHEISIRGRSTGVGIDVLKITALPETPN